MTNDITDADLEDAAPCFALSKNDSYVMSASGGKISLFNMMTFKVSIPAYPLLLSLNEFTCLEPVLYFQSVYIVDQRKVVFHTLLI